MKGCDRSNSETEAQICDGGCGFRDGSRPETQGRNEGIVCAHSNAHSSVVRTI